MKRRTPLAGAVCLFVTIASIGCQDEPIPIGVDLDAALPDDSNPASGDSAPPDAAPYEPTPPNCDEPEGELLALELTPVATGIGEAVHLARDPTDPLRWFVVERMGRVLIVQNGQVLPQPFLSLDVDTTYVENGLLGLALHPDYGENGLFYLHYIAPRAIAPDGGELQGNLVIAEYERDPESEYRALTEPRRVLLDLEQPTQKHKAGTMQFDREGRLLIAIGNSGLESASEDITDLRGAVLRIDPAPDEPGYVVPEDNPRHEGWAPELLETGLRNPWRIALDPCTDDLYIGDVGSNMYEEINISSAGEHGKDFGFPQVEGTECYRHIYPDNDCSKEGKVPPLGGYRHCTYCAIIGGEVYRGHAIPALRGTYIYGDVTGRLFALRYRDGEVTDEREITDLFASTPGDRMTAIVSDADHELLLLNRRTKTVYRIEAAN